MKRSDGGMAIGSAAGALGAAAAAILGTLCCAGPAVVGIIGAGGALTAAKLEPYRPYFLTASIAMLAFGFWRAYRPMRAGKTGASCTIGTGRVVRAILWFSAVVTLASALAPRFWS
jgi:mercuric ion transport protein